MDRVKSWIINHKLEFLLLASILVIGAFLRLYKINEYMTFLGDEGRDVIIVRRLLVELHPPLIGPGTSIGNMYLGPLYYYMMAIPLLLANFNPVGPAVFIALLGISTIWFLWFVIKEFFPTEKVNTGALLASLLYAISPVIITYSKSSWNPNIMPFFSLLTIYAMWKTWLKGQYKWLVIGGVSFAFVLQSHYLGLLLAPTIFVVWFLAFIKSQNKKRLVFFSFLSLILFLLLMSPLMFFDLRHNFINFNAIKAFFTNRETTVSVLPWKAIPGIWPILNLASTDLVAAKVTSAGTLTASIIAFYFIYEYLIRKEKYNLRKVSIVLIITLWLGFALLGLALYKQHIYDHYLGFIFTVPFIIMASVIQLLIDRFKNLGLIIGIIFVILIGYLDLINSPIRFPPNKQLERAQAVAKKVEDIANNKNFNFALIADNNYDSAYKYFLILDKAKVVDINPQNTKDSITDQLIVVCELEIAKCDPTHNPKTEIAAWGWSKVDVEYDNVDGVTIFKLAHAQ
ncbi:MAG TPA: glycosyltransferase family 39 protein [Patescibacteria group bacterium]|nr:glycosyltransferase family 39 protein [Patescibacteria group bacterium]